MTGFRLLTGDNRALLRAMPAASVDSFVEDPPYGLSFMSRGWDHAVPGPEYFAEQLRVAKPGAHLVAFGGTRTYHRLICAIEDAGWEIRDCLMWMYGSGFPKSHNGDHGGTALKPGWEPIALARKPLAGTVADNHAAHGLGGLNIDACRVEAQGRPRRVPTVPGKSVTAYGNGLAGSRAAGETDLGRWPVNVALDPEAAAALDAQTGTLTSGGMKAGTVRAPNSSPALGAHTGNTTSADIVANSGGPSRFFYCAKASKSEREAGLGRFEAVTVSDGRKTVNDTAYQRDATQRKNIHPTVKPIALMRWLCRLITPPGGLVCDPFMGSGTTGCAAALEGFRFVGMDLEPAHVEIARARAEHWLGQAGRDPRVEMTPATAEHLRELRPATAQLGFNLGGAA